jgi:hypothetical protein
VNCDEVEFAVVGVVGEEGVDALVGIVVAVNGGSGGKVNGDEDGSRTGERIDDDVVVSAGTVTVLVVKDGSGGRPEGKVDDDPDKDVSNGKEMGEGRIVGTDGLVLSVIVAVIDADVDKVAIRAIEALELESVVSTVELYTAVPILVVEVALGSGNRGVSVVAAASNAVVGIVVLMGVVENAPKEKACGMADVVLCGTLARTNPGPGSTDTASWPNSTSFPGSGKTISRLSIVVQPGPVLQTNILGKSAIDVCRFVGYDRGPRRILWGVDALICTRAQF